jgi:hypothetical protein
VKQGRDQPLVEQAYRAELAFRQGELERALAMSTEVLGAAGTTGLRVPMVTLQRQALLRLGRSAEVLDLDAVPGVQPMPPLMRARALAAVGRLAEAESEARRVMDLPEAGALVAELLVAQDLDGRAGDVVTPESAMQLTRRVATLEPLDPTRARRLATVVSGAADSSPLARALACMTSGDVPNLETLDGRERWMVEVELAARSADAAGFEQAVRDIPDSIAAYIAQERLHLLGRYDQSARIGSVAGSDPAAQYILARSFARAGHPDRAMEALDRAVSAGWANAPEAVTEPDLAALQGRRDWRGLVERMAAGST